MKTGPRFVRKLQLNNLQPFIRYKINDKSTSTNFCVKPVNYKFFIKDLSYLNPKLFLIYAKCSLKRRFIAVSRSFFPHYISVIIYKWFFHLGWGIPLRNRLGKVTHLIRFVLHFIYECVPREKLTNFCCALSKLIHPLKVYVMCGDM